MTSKKFDSTSEEEEEGEIVDVIDEDPIDIKVSTRRTRFSDHVAQPPAEIISENSNKSLPKKLDHRQFYWQNKSFTTESNAINLQSNLSDFDQPKLNILIPQYNFEIKTNVIVLKQLPTRTLHTHPQTEIFRANFLRELYKTFHSQCRNLYKINTPNGSFQGWLMETKISSSDDLDDPLIPSNFMDNLYSMSMPSAIAEAIPFRTKVSSSIHEAKEQLARYLMEAKIIIFSDTEPPDGLKSMILNGIDTNIAWLRENPDATLEDYQIKLDEVRQECQLLINESVKSSVAEQCYTLSNLSSLYSQRLQLYILQMHTKSAIVLPMKRELLTEPIENDLCLPISYSIPSIEMPLIEVKKLDQRLILCYQPSYLDQPVFQKINEHFFTKLACLYRLNCLDDQRDKLFLPRVWCLLKRYKTLCGEYNRDSPISAERLQASLTPYTFQILNIHFGVTFECFASPMNCYFRQYCSAFIDTDAHFGSHGSFFSFYPIMGSFQANPPAVNGLFNATLAHIETILAASKQPLSFIVFLMEGVIHNKFIESTFYRHCIIVHRLIHRYRHGYDYILSESISTLRSATGVSVYWLQNDAGYNLWPPTTYRIQKLHEALRT